MKPYELWRVPGVHQHGGNIDPYGAENPAEFFAVVSEVFFETPGALHDTHPDLYEQLRLFYRQHPLKRLEVIGQPMKH